MAQIDKFTYAPDDPLALEHAAIERWVEDAAQTRNPNRYWKSPELKSLESGRMLLDSGPERAARLVRAAVAQARHWDEQIGRLRAEAKNEMARNNLHLNPDWGQVWYPRLHTVSAMGALLRRTLPLERGDIEALLAWCISFDHLTPITQVTKALQRFAASHPLDPELRDAIRKFAASLRSSHIKEAKRLGTVAEQLCAEDSGDAAPAEPSIPVKATPAPSFAGGPLVLYDLKCLLEMARADPELARIPVGLDRFNMLAASPLCGEHERLTRLFAAVVETPGYYRPDLRTSEEGRAILDLDPVGRGRVLLAAAERHVAALLAPGPKLTDHRHWQAHYAAAGTALALAALPVALNRDGLFDFLLYLSTRPAHERIPDTSVEALSSSIAALTENGAPLTEGERFVLHLWRSARIQGPLLGIPSPDIARLTQWIGDGARFYLAPGEYWSDTVNADLAGFPAALGSQWVILLKHLLTATSSRPSGRWRDKAMKLVENMGAGETGERLERWLALVAKGRSTLNMPAYVSDTRGGADSIHDENANALRGMLWLLPQMPRREDLARLAGSVAFSAYRKTPGVGPRAVKVGNAAVYALSEMASPEAIAQLAVLKVRVRFGTAQKEIEKAFDSVAAALKLPRDQIEELSAPSCGLETVGRSEATVGGYRAELTVTGSHADLNWSDAKGKTLKAPPAAVKKESAETLRDLQAALKDIRALIPAQTDRIDALFLERKSWPAAVWRERYLDHPLVGTIARRLIWCAGSIPATFEDGQAWDIRGTRLEISDAAEVTLWHPVGRSIEEVVEWRRRIESLGMVQPFKQAHREVYLLTDAERRTETYSNRFAAHILRQHQFNALCAARRWKNKLRLLVDDSYPPAIRELPAWGLRAEFWIEGIGTEYGQDTNDSGVFLRLATDQVRFYRAGAAMSSAHARGGSFAVRAHGPGLNDINEPIPLDQVPELVFSETMRDVDLFVGVASVGNDPTWVDGGPGGLYRNYWESYSFGELSATAITRKEALERLLPRLKIASQCTLQERFLTVRGDKRNYKIHLGSGNILMEPNDQYLCIVPDSHARLNQEQMYLPFEGDRTLSIILSKAFLLAEDWKIKDPTITRQIAVR